MVPLVPLIVTTLFFSLIGQLSITLAADLTTLEPKVPLEFPKYDEKYNFINNSTIRENLASHNENNSTIFLNDDDDGRNNITLQNYPFINDTEVEDLLKKSDDNFTEIAENIDSISSQLLEPKIVNNNTNPSMVFEDLFDKNETELIENGENTEDILLTREFRNDANNALIRGQLAAILAGVFMVVAIIAYALLLSWRHHLEAKYGSREMLFGEDMNDPDDMKHFSI